MKNTFICDPNPYTYYIHIDKCKSLKWERMVEREEERIVDKKRDKEVIHITWGCNGETDRERRQRGTV